VVLYEMLTRTTPFEARTPNGTIGLIVGPQAPALALPEKLPPLFRNIVQKALNKDREDRYQTVTRLAADLTLLQKELERDAPNDVIVPGPARLDWYSIGNQKTRTLTTGSVFSRFKSQAIHTADLLFHEMRLPSLFAGMTVALILLMFLPDLIKPVMDPTSVATPVQLQMKPVTNSGTSICSAISADGRLVAHAEEQDGKQRLMVKNTATSVSSTVVPAEEVEYLGVTFSADNNYLYFTRTESSRSGILYRVAVPGAPPVKLKEGVDSPVSLSPQGDQFAFVRLDTTTNEYSVVVSDIAGTEERTLATRKDGNRFSTYGLAWSPDGKTVVCPAGRWNKGFHIDLIAIDVNTGKEQQIGNRSWSSVYQLAWQNDMSGLIISARQRTMAPHQLWRVTFPAGDVQRLTNDFTEYRGVSLSGEKIVTVKTDWTWKMWRSSIGSSSQPVAITQGWGLMYGICWTATGKIVYSSMAQDRLDLWRIDANGSNNVQLTVDSGDNYTPAASADGKFIVFTSARTDGFDIYRLNIATGNNVKRLTHSDGNAYPYVSGDNQWVVYDHVDQLGRSVWKVPLEGGESVKLSDGYRMPVYSPDNQLIVARSPLNSGNGDVAIFSANGGAPLKRLNIQVMEWQRLYWLDNHTLSFIKEIGGTSNIWSYDINTDEAKQLTNFNGEQIFTYAWSPDYKEIVCQRGTKLSNVTIIGSEQ
jgi:Tol biopolymer transport system component